MSGVKRARKIALVVLGLLLLGLTALFLRGTVFAPRFDVVSIATAAEYQDPRLLDRAWALPVATTYAHSVVSQSNGSRCGPSTLANAFRSLADSAPSEGAVLAGTGMCITGYCIPGVTLDELATLARKKTQHKVTVLRDLSLDEFRQHLRRSNDPSRRYAINFQRGLLFGKGTGHHSPIAGYLEDRDLVFVLDVNAKYGPWLVSSERLYEAMDSVDSSSGKKRGMLLLE
jgi:hypothetical protein